MPGLNTTVTKSSGSPQTSDSPSSYISITACDCINGKTHMICMYTGKNHKPMHTCNSKHVRNYMTHYDSVDSFDDNEAALVFDEVHQWFIHVTLHLLWNNGTPIPFQNLPPTKQSTTYDIYQIYVSICFVSNRARYNTSTKYICFDWWWSSFTSVQTHTKPTFQHVIVRSARCLIHKTLNILKSSTDQLSRNYILFVKQILQKPFKRPIWFLNNPNILRILQNYP